MNIKVEKINEYLFDTIMITEFQSMQMNKHVLLWWKIAFVKIS